MEATYFYLNSEIFGDKMACVCRQDVEHEACIQNFVRKSLGKVQYKHRRDSRN
jgi:hypothetical protein